MELGSHCEQRQPEKFDMLGKIRIDTDLKDKQKQLVIAGIPVLFPFDPYPIQTEYMTSIIRSLSCRENSLLQSPTGTGKTLSLLCSTLAWLKNHRQQHPKQAHPVRIIYLSRTHAQLKQVISELKRTAYRPNIVVSASRDHACCNGELRGMSGSLKELECRKRVAGGDIQCKFYRLEGTYTALAGKATQKVMDLEELVNYGAKHLMCPFYYSKRVKQQMDVVFMPYNYLLDRNIANLYSIDCTNSILIFDQGHNVPSVSQSCNSYQISTFTLATAIQQLAKLKEVMLLSAKGVNPKDRKSVAALNYFCRDGEFKATISMIEAYIRPINNLLVYFQGRIHQMFNSQVEMEEGFLMNFQAFWNQIIDGVKPQQILNHFGEYEAKQDAIKSDMVTLPNWALQAWALFIKQSYKIAKGSSQANSSVPLKSRYKAHARMDGNNFILKLLCLDPCRSFQSLATQKPYSFIITSGTLSPLNFWQYELGLKFPRPLACPHFLTDSQLFASVVTCGPSKQPFNFNYDNRSNRAMVLDLGKILVQICKIAPGGVVILFSSYGLMDAVKGDFQQTGLMQQFYLNKEVFHEDRSSVGFKEQLQAFSRQSKTKKGAVIFAVTRGKIAEGIDLCDDQCRAIVLVGVPYPPIKDKKIQAKRSYLDSQQTGITGKQWYLAEAYRAINQAIGRVIRNSNDYGAIYLIDQRFQNKDLKEQLSEWARKRLEVYYDSTRLIQDSKKFFNGKKPEVKILKPSTQVIKKVQLPVKVQNEGQIITIPQSEIIPFKGISLGRKVNISKRFVVPLQPPAPPRAVKSQGFQPKAKNDQLKAFLQEIKHQQSQKSSSNNSQNPAVKPYDIVKPIPIELKPERKSLNINRISGADKSGFHNQLAKPSQSQRLEYRRLNFDDQNRDIQDECPICRTKKKLIRNKACSHALCMLCWEMWLKNRLSCPICRERVRKPYLIAQ